MALAPVQLISDFMEDYPNYWLKFYEQGTTTPLAMAIDSTGSPTVAKAEISAGPTPPLGLIKTAGNVTFIPYLDQAYDAYIFPTEAEADANNTTNAIQLADNVDPFLVSDNEISATTTMPNLILPSDQVNYQAENNFTGGVDRTAENKFADLPSLLDFTGIDNTGVTDSTAGMILAAASGESIIHAPDGTYLFDAITIPTQTNFVGGPKAIFKCRTATVNWISFQVNSGKGFQGGIQGISLEGDAKADWGIFIDSWESGKFDKFEAQGFLKGLFDITSDQTLNSEFSNVSDVVLTHDGVTRTPRFARVREGTAGHCSEIGFIRCRHVGITNGNIVGIDPTTGVSSDTAGIGIELIDVKRCKVQDFYTGNNQDGTVGSYDCSVYIQNRGTSPIAGIADTGSHNISDIYFEQLGTAPGILALPVIINGNSLVASRFTRYSIVRDINASAQAPPTLIEFRNDSATANLNRDNEVYLSTQAPASATAIVVDADVLSARINGLVGTSQVTDNGTNTVINGVLVDAVVGRGATPLAGDDGDHIRNASDDSLWLKDRGVYYRLTNGEATTAELEDSANAVNISASKVEGFVVTNTDTGLSVAAAGDAGNSDWLFLGTGNVAHTPV